MRENSGGEVDLVPLDKVSEARVPPKCLVVSIVELDHALLQDATEDELRSVQVLTENASEIVWITGGGLLGARQPEFAVVLGLSRAVMLEQPALNFFILDIENTNAEREAIGNNLLSILDYVPEKSDPELEFFQKDRILYTSRFVADKAMNQQFEERQHKKTVSRPISQVDNCQLNIQTPGSMDTLHFIETGHGEGLLRPDYVEVEVKCISLNAKVLNIVPP